MTLLLVLGVFALAFASLLLSLRALSTTGVPVRAASPEAVAAALELLALKPGETFADLGCSGGQVLRAARARADVRALGWELNPGAFLMAFLRKDRRTQVRFGDFRFAKLDGLDAAYAYLMPRAMAELAQPLEQKLKPGTRLVSVDFAIPGWTPVEVREVGPLRQPIHLYVVGRHRAA